MCYKFTYNVRAHQLTYIVTTEIKLYLRGEVTVLAESLDC